MSDRGRVRRIWGDAMNIELRTSSRSKAVVACIAFAVAVLFTAWPSTARADTAVELLHGWNYNNDFNGGTERTIMTIKTFQPFKYGSFFMYYDITGPFTPPDDKVLPNEKGGFFGGTSVNLSVKRIGEKIAGETWNWGGALVDVSLHSEVEHVSKVGMLTYFGPLFDLKIPGFDFAAFSSVIRQDWTLNGIDLQLGGAWQITFPIGKITDIVFDGFFQWGMFGEGHGTFTTGPDDKGQYTVIPTRGRPFFMTQPQLLLDIGKLTTVAERTFYVGLEYQFAFNRYLQPGVMENVPQIMFRWSI